MEWIDLPNNRQALRVDGVVFQEFKIDSEPAQIRWAKERWMQDFGRPDCAQMPAPNPVKMLGMVNAMFVRTDGDPVLVGRGDYLARDGAGRCACVPVAEVRHYAPLAVRADAPHAQAQMDAEGAIKRMGRIRAATHERMGEAAACPIGVKENKDGAFDLVSTLPNGQEKAWKTFAWESAARRFLDDDKNRDALVQAHVQKSASMERMHNMADVLRKNKAR